PFLCTGLLVMCRSRAPGPLGPARPLLLLLLAWWLAPALYLTGVPFESARFTLIYMPPLAILEAIGLAAAARWWPAPGRTAAWLACALALLGLGILALDARDPLAALARGKAADLAAVQWLTTHVPDHASIATFGLTLTLYHEGNLQARHWQLADLSAVTPAGLRRLAQTGRLVVVANEANLRAQWRGLPPETALLWLQDHVRLRRMTSAGGYTIWERP
ncbi:MAG TPA: hypothetical protein VHB98_20790, partial [Chloroflexota bacterium]|nr:hypothetical protein [Chloroflexota bacterium]